MRIYQFSVVTHAGEKLADEDIVCMDHNEALLLAKNMLKNCRSVEVWYEARVVGSFPSWHIVKIP